jgi:hypothetical protein
MNIVKEILAMVDLRMVAATTGTQTSNTTIAETIATVPATTSAGVAEVGGMTAIRVGVSEIGIRIEVLYNANAGVARGAHPAVDMVLVPSAVDVTQRRIARRIGLGHHRPLRVKTSSGVISGPNRLCWM